MGVTPQNGGKDVQKRGFMCIRRHVKERGKYNALVLTEAVIPATRWTVFLCLHEGRHGHMTRSCQRTVSRQACAIPQEKPQPICNLPCFLLLISAPPAIADTYGTHRMTATNEPLCF